MKITVNIDCTAEEARQFLGLPDVQPLQEAVMAEVRDRLVANMRSMDVETLTRQWMPAGLTGMDQWQKAFWGAMTAAAGRKTEDGAS